MAIGPARLLRTPLLPAAAFAAAVSCSGARHDGTACAGAACPGGPPGAGPPPSGAVGPSGGTVERLWFATTGDTRPAQCDATDGYPRGVMARIATSMKALGVQFALDLGDHMFVCNQSFAEAEQQMGYYLAAIAQGPATWFMTMGNHECGNARPFAQGCFDSAIDANFRPYRAALGRPLPYYAVDVGTGLGLARLVVVADDAYDRAQAEWLQRTPAGADARARLTVVARAHPHHRC